MARRLIARERTLADAWRVFYAEHGPAMASLARALAPDLAEDALHDVVAHEIAKGRVPPERIEYMARAIRNRIAAIRRRQPPPPTRRTESGGEAISGGRGILMMLDETDRAIVVLRVQCGLSFPQIAAALDCPTGTVSSRFARAMEGLRAQLEPEGRSDEREARIAVA